MIWFKHTSKLIPKPRLFNTYFHKVRSKAQQLHKIFDIVTNTRQSINIYIL